MNIETYFPFWVKLEDYQKEIFNKYAIMRNSCKGEVIHRGSDDCVGLIIVTKGILRIFTLSDEGREITLYRLFDRDICLMSASCMINSIEFDVTVEAVCDSEFIQIPAHIYKDVMRKSVAAANFTNELMAARFSDVMFLLNQILYKKLDSRLAAFLLEEYEVSEKQSLYITHEEIANNLGTAREVITRMLKYLVSEGVISLSRKEIVIKDIGTLRKLAADSVR